MVGVAVAVEGLATHHPLTPQGHLRTHPSALALATEHTVLTTLMPTTATCTILLASLKIWNVKPR